MTFAYTTDYHFVDFLTDTVLLVDTYAPRGADTERGAIAN